MFVLASCVAASVIAAAPEIGEPTATEAERLDEIVVLGRRTAPRDRTLGAGLVTERLSPSSRSVERELLQAVGAVRLNDALELVSGISQQNNRGGVMDNFAIRGFLGTPDGGAEYYVDGFLANRGMAPPRDPATAERVEVLKGPAGALFGDIDPAGRVNLVSRTPRFATDARFTATIGSFGVRRGELDLTGPLSDSLAGRLVVAGETSTGWRDHVGLDRTVVSPSLTWRSQDDVRVTYVGEFTTFTTLFDRGLPALNGDPLELPPSRYYGEPGDGETRFRNERHQITGEWRLPLDWSLNAGAAWRGGSLRGLSSDHSRLVGDTLWRQRRGRDFSVEDLSGRVELNGEVQTGSGVHRIGLGVKAYRLAYGEKWLRINPSATQPYPINVHNPVYGGAAPEPLPFTDNLESRSVLTLYAQDLWEVTDRLSLLGGLRYDDYTQEIRNNRTGAQSLNEGGPVDYRAALRYRLSEGLTAHASWGRSFVLNSGTGRNGLGFAPETSEGFEFGLAVAREGLDFAATVFDVEKSGILTADPVDPSYLAPVGRLTSRGVELDGSLEFDETWRVVGAYAWTDARADDAAFATEDVLNIPAHSGSIFLVGRFSTPQGTDWSLMAGAAYVGDRAAALDGSGVRLPAYWKAKAALEYALTPQVSGRLEVDNLFDEHYAASSYSNLWIFPGAPRSLRLALTVAL